MGWWIVVAFVVVVLLVVVGLYNGLVNARARVRESWSGVDTELQRRHDLVPNLVAAVKGYMRHESELLTRLVDLREEAERLRPGEATEAQLRVESQLQSTLGTLRARMEAYPDLKASASFLSLQGELANTEDRVQGALRFYNASVRELNVKCEAFPSNLVASTAGFRPAEFFELRDDAAREAPKVEI